MPAITNQWSYRECYPEPASPDQANANLAMAVIAAVAHDLQAGSSRKRAEARLARVDTAPELLRWLVEQDRTGQPDPVTVPSETVPWIQQTLRRRRTRMLN